MIEETTQARSENYRWHISWSYGARWPSDGVHEAIVVAPTDTDALAIARRAASREGCSGFGFRLISKTAFSQTDS